MKKRKYFNINIIPLSLLFVCISIILPRYTNIEHRFEFGYPIKYLTIYDSIINIKPGESLLGYIRIDLGVFIVDILIICVVLTCLFNTIRQLKNNKVEVCIQHNGYIIRELRKEEIGVLSDFLYEAIFQGDENNLLPRDIIKKPELSVYIDNFGQKDDNCLVAECDGEIVGAVWTRIIKGYGNVDEETPEFSISLYKDYRGKGIGTNMMREMLEVLRTKGYHQTSLSVQKDNYAFKMYKNLGFEIIDELEEEVLMLYKFN